MTKRTPSGTRVPGLGPEEVTVKKEAHHIPDHPADRPGRDKHDHSEDQHLALTFPARLGEELSIETAEPARGRVVVAAGPGGAAPVPETSLEASVHDREAMLRTARGRWLRFHSEREV